MPKVPEKYKQLPLHVPCSSARVVPPQKKLDVDPQGHQRYLTIWQVLNTSCKVTLHKAYQH